MVYMRKIIATILSLCALCAFGLSNASRHFAPVSAAAETATHARSSETELLAPSSYEQYLALQTPSDVTISERYTAIADGNKLYVYDRDDDVYRQYTHTNQITKLQFDDNARLYFLDQNGALYILAPDAFQTADAQATSLSLTCATFAIVGSTMYYSTTSGTLSYIYKASLNNLSAATMLWRSYSLPPTLAYYDRELYYTESGKHLYKLDPDDNANPVFVAVFSTTLLSMTVADGVFACVTGDNDFFAYDLNELTESKDNKDVTPLLKESDGYVALTAKGDFIYAVRNKTVQQYSVETSRFTNYEISGASSASNRLNGATDVCLSGNKLFLSDAGNRRISVFDAKTKTFENTVSVSLSAKYVASNGETFLAAGTAKAELYDISSSGKAEKRMEKSNFDGNVVGATCVYGNYYLVTDLGYFYSLTEENDEYVWRFAQKSSERSPSLLTSDAYGNLYVAYQNSVYTYTEQDFATATLSKKSLTEALPEGTEKLCADYDRNLYALKGNVLYKFVASADKTTYTESGSFSLSNAPVYDASAKATSFALSVEENQTYILYNGTYLVRTTSLQLPTVKNIPVGEAATQIFSGKNDFSVVLTTDDALVVEYDFTKLPSASVFPYLSYVRLEDEMLALKIGQTGAYDLLVVYDETAREYKTYLAYASSCRPVLRSQYETLYDQPQTGYLTGSASLYRYPFLSELLTDGTLERGAELMLLGEITLLEREYYAVSYSDADGNAKTGYLPKVCVTPLDGKTDASLLTVGETASRTDAYGRLIYLLLGCAAICVLTDFLILRRFKSNENENKS